jgi:hypothetical protein
MLAPKTSARKDAHISNVTLTFANSSFLIAIISPRYIVSSTLLYKKYAAKT